ncbi:electron transfer flavoprotein subunit alpha/FixB family protein [Cryptosporangium arvum]|uniref:electron transfer flavoprotein subunit alpha/FixB family protein n=1 Tax=Cryptosporangium arvum TaxID=80871 RepID=UPI0004B88315|nr:electron transfer flavoprotein subunit alpha/FixB family protein [Cryptosporangium arvum]
MAEVLVLVEHVDGAVKKISLELLTAARALGEPSAVVVGTPGTAAGYADTLKEYGAAKIYAAESEDVLSYLVAPKASILASLAASASPAAILIAATAEGKEIAGRLAVKLESGLLYDVVDLGADGVATQAIFAGQWIVKSQVTSGTPILVLKGGAVDAAAAPAAGELVAVDVSLDEAATKAKILDRVVESSGSRPELTDANIVVSGGRGVGSADNFKVVEDLADSLGAAVGASRAAVDSGFYPHQFQVGQTGKTVSPQLYVALGISGAIQHRAGMQTSKTIVAVNKDAEAPIFELADYGVVGDLFAVAPQAAEEVRKRKG